MKRTYGKALALLLIIITVLSISPLGVFAEAASDALNQEKTVYVLAGSDFQPENDDQALGRERVDKILTQIKNAGYTQMDGFLFAGDYARPYTEEPAKTGLATLKQTVAESYGDGLHQVFVQGNHDPDSIATDGTLSPSGANDAEDYGVFVVHHKDYMKNSTEANKPTIEQTAANLKAYLDAKVAQRYEKPIFVISHVPLHYTMRSDLDGDGIYAYLLFNAMNEAAAAGLRIIFMYGHNHSHGWDDYMGGGSVYLAPGDKINIGQGDKTSYKEETLGFTYMNAGFVGYYGTTGSADTVDSTLTMTVFAITDDQIKIERYDADGLHNLKAQGVLRVGDTTSAKVDPYEADTRVYASPQYISLEHIQTDPTGTVTVEAFNVTAVTASKTEKIEEGYSKYAVLDIRVEGYTQGDPATVTVKLDPDFAADTPVTVMDTEKGTSITADIVDGAVTFTVDHFGEFVIAQVDMSQTETEPASDTEPETESEPEPATTASPDTETSKGGCRSALGGWSAGSVSAVAAAVMVLISGRKNKTETGSIA